MVVQEVADMLFQLGKYSALTFVIVYKNKSFRHTDSEILLFVMIIGYIDIFHPIITYLHLNQIWNFQYHLIS